MTTGRSTGETGGEHALASVLTALGALLEELRDARRATGRPSGAASEAGAPIVEPPPARGGVPRLARPPVGRAMTQPPFGSHGTDESPEDEVALLLTDARERAQAIIDESISRAQDLLRAQPSSQALERIRRTVADLSVDVRAIHSRLDEIEALIRGGAVAYRTPAIEARPAPAAYAPPPTYAPPPAPGYAPPQAAYAPPPTFAPQPEPPAYRAPEPASPPAPTAPVFEPPPPAAEAPAPPVAPTAPPPSQAPPWSATPPPPPPPPPAAQVAPAPPPPAAPVEPPPPPAVAPPAPVAPSGFDPASGSVALRISPVAGFQGLMRVQDALARCRGVREAGVEAYAQGEARLRLHFSEPIDGTRLAAALAETLARGVRLVAESTSDRTIQLALE